MVPEYILTLVPGAAAIAGSPTFYILLLVVAAAAIVAVTRPHRGGPVREMSVQGILVYGMPDPEPRIELAVTDTGETVIVRSGWQGLEPRGVRADIEIKGFDITVTEQIIYGGSEEIDCVEFHLPRLALSERYHLQYKTDHLGRNVAFSFRVTPGVRIHRPLP